MDMNIEEFRKNMLKHKNSTTEEIDNYIKIMDDLLCSQEDMYHIIKIVNELSDHVIEEYQRLKKEIAKL